MLLSSVPLSETDIERLRAYEIPRRLAGSQALDDDEEVRSIASPVTLEQLVFRFVTELLRGHRDGRRIDHFVGRVELANTTKSTQFIVHSRQRSACLTHRSLTVV